MNLAICDFSLDGHRASYIRAIAIGAAKKRWKTTVVLPQEAQAHPAIGAIRSSIGLGCMVFSDHPMRQLEGTSPLSLMRHHIGNHFAAVKALEPVLPDCDFVYFPTLDVMDKAMLVFGTPSGRVPMGGMCMRARFHMTATGVEGRIADRSSVINEFAFRRLLKTTGVRCITTSDPTLEIYARRQGGSDFDKVMFVPELGMVRPSVAPVEARRLWGFGPDDKIILIYGAISRRKGVRDLLNALSGLNGTTIRVLIVGAADDEMKEYLSTPFVLSLIASGLVRLCVAYSDDNTEAAAFAAADAVWVAYRDHSTMSGVFLQAICAHVPVITANYGIMAWLASRDGVGISVDPNDTKNVSSQISEMFAESARLCAYREKAAQIAERHSPSSFGNSICDAIQASLA